MILLVLKEAEHVQMMDRHEAGDGRQREDRATEAGLETDMVSAQIDSMVVSSSMVFDTADNMAASG